MGYGKSKTTIDLITYKYQQGCIDVVIILAPGLVLRQWKEQLETHCRAPYSFLLYRAHSPKKMLSDLDDFIQEGKKSVKIIAMSYDTLARERHFNAVQDICKTHKVYAILDEATRIKNIDSLRTKTLLRIRKYFSQVLLLTGTAFAKRPSDIWPLYRFMDYSILDQPYTAFRQEYMLLVPQTIFQKGVGKQVLTPLSADRWQYFKNKLAASNIVSSCTEKLLSLSEKLGVNPSVLREISKQETYYPFRNIEKLKNIIAPYTDFISDEDDLGLEKLYKPVIFDTPPVIIRLIKALKKSALAQYQDTVMTVSSAMGLQHKALQIAGNHFIDIDDEVKPIEPNDKLAYILDFIETNTQEQVLIFAVFKAEITTIYESLKKAGTACAIIDGRIDVTTRDKSIEAFKKGELSVLICNPAVAGYGMNLQNAHYQIWYSRNFDTEARIQAESRTLRYGSHYPTTYIDLMYDLAFERRVYTMNRQAQHMNEAFNKNGAVFEQLTIEQIFEI